MKKLLPKISTAIGCVITLVTAGAVFSYRISNPHFTETEILINTGMYYIPAIVIGILLTTVGISYLE